MEAYRVSTSISANDERYLQNITERLKGGNINAITQYTVHKLAAELYPDCKPQTRNRQVITPIVSVLHNAAKSDPSLSWVRIEKLKEIRPDVKVTLPEEAEKIISLAKGELRVLLMTFVYQGWRNAETLMIRRENITADSIRRWVTKSQEFVVTPLDALVRKALLSLPLHTDGRVFSYNHRNDVYRQLKKISSTYTPHQSRRGFATALNDRGVGVKDIAAAGGWKDIQSVLRHYIYVDFSRAESALGRIRG